MEFIKNHAMIKSDIIGEDLCRDIILKKYSNDILLEKIKPIEKYIPKIYNKQIFQYFGNPELVKNQPFTEDVRKRMRPTLYDKNNCTSELTVYIHLNTVKGEIFFYDDPKNNIHFVQKAEFFRSPSIAGTVIIFSNRVKYIEKSYAFPRYVLIIPVFYKNINTLEFRPFRFYPLRHNRKVRFKTECNTSNKRNKIYLTLPEVQ